MPWIHKASPDAVHRSRLGALRRTFAKERRRKSTRGADWIRFSTQGFDGIADQFLRGDQFLNTTGPNMGTEAELQALPETRIWTTAWNDWSVGRNGFGIVRDPASIPILRKYVESGGGLWIFDGYLNFLNHWLPVFPEISLADLQGGGIRLLYLQPAQGQPGDVIEDGFYGRFSVPSVVTLPDSQAYLEDGHLPGFNAPTTFRVTENFDGSGSSAAFYQRFNLGGGRVIVCAALNPLTLSFFENTGLWRPFARNCADWLTKQSDSRH